jgi:hypothetical protein
MRDPLFHQRPFQERDPEICPVTAHQRPLTGERPRKFSPLSLPPSESSPMIDF